MEDRSGPRYIAIAEALAEDVEAGRLAAGSRLPTQRDLAWRLGVTVGTVTRAYAEAERRGLIAGEVGRGTFVRERVPLGPPAPGGEAPDGGLIDLSYNFPPLDLEPGPLSDAVAEVAAEGGLRDVLAYQLGFGLPPHRAAGAAWVSESGMPAEAADIMVTAGAQHGMLLAMGALARPGDAVLTEELTFYGIKSIASLLDLRLHGLAMDAHGLLPEALDAACRSTGAKVLYCIPTLQNPTTAIMPEARRREVAAVCRRHDVSVVEDDIYAFLPSSAPPPLSSLLPERAVYVTSLSKCVAPGLRVGFIRAERALLERLRLGLRASILMAPPLMAEVAARLIGSGQARRLALGQRAEARVRQQMAARALPAAALETYPEAFHLWLKLPEPWRREVFAAETRARGVAVAPADAFAVGRQPVPHAVRVCLQAARSRHQVDKALKVLAEVLAGQPSTHLPVV